MRKDWVLEIQAQCQRNRVPFFFKQWGGVNKKKTGRLLEGRTWGRPAERVFAGITVVLSHFVEPVVEQATLS